MLEAPEAYELWIAWLLETDPKDWSAKVKRDFAGLTTTQADYTHAYVLTEDGLAGPPQLIYRTGPEVWYAEHRFELFSELRKRPTDSWDVFSGVPSNPTDEHLILTLNLSAPIGRLLAMVERRIRIHKPTITNGRPKRETQWASYKFSQAPNCEALAITLFVYRMKKDTGKTDWEIGDEVAKNFPVMRNQRLSKRDTKAEATAKKHALANVVNRYLKTAKQIKANVAKGQFP